jgi:hypothetical protein
MKVGEQMFDQIRGIFGTLNAAPHCKFSRTNQPNSKK